MFTPFSLGSFSKNGFSHRIERMDCLALSHGSTAGSRRTRRRRRRRRWRVFHAEEEESELKEFTSHKKVDRVMHDKKRRKSCAPFARVPRLTSQQIIAKSRSQIQPESHESYSRAAFSSLSTDLKRHSPTEWGQKRPEKKRRSDSSRRSYSVCKKACKEVQDHANGEDCEILDLRSID